MKNPKCRGNNAVHHQEKLWPGPARPLSVKQSHIIAVGEKQEKKRLVSADRKDVILSQQADRWRQLSTPRQRQGLTAHRNPAAAHFEITSRDQLRPRKELWSMLCSSKKELQAVRKHEEQ
ncbi:unnamed protein product [Cercospora beticola]|nr:unnamed protein product [Cercospora beticola]